jgi:hypothetical protein
VANWSSIVSGRKQSASDLFSVPNIVYPSPKPIPGTPHQKSLLALFVRQMDIASLVMFLMVTDHFLSETAV